MNNLVIMKDQQAVTSSLQVAEVFEKQHKHVLGAIENLVAENSAAKYFAEGTYENRGKEYPLYYMNRDGFTLLAMGFTGQKALQFKLKYIEAFNQMEKEIQQPKLPTSKRELAMLALSANEETNERVDNIDKRLVDIEENKLISTEDKGTIDSRVRKKVYYLCKEQRLSQEAKSMLFQDLGSSIKRLFNVPNRGRIKDKDFQRVLEFIDNWQPSSVTKEQIKQLELEMF